MEALSLGVQHAGCSGECSPTGSEPLAPTAAACVLQSSGSGPSAACHPNVFVRGLPLQWGENEITSIFGQFGALTSLRLVRHSVTKHSLGYGFVRYGTVAEAQAAIAMLDGTSVLGHSLQVKFADADAGPPTTPAPSGLTPSDSCYVKHLPASYSAQDVQQMFEVHGAVLDLKLFPCLDQVRGASALVRMASVEAADRAIAALNNTTAPGAMQSLIVRFAESAAEKAARLTRREAKSLQRLPSGGGLQLRPGGPAGALQPDQLQQALSALGLGSLHQVAALRPQPAVVPQPYQPQVLSSVCVKGLPAGADRLWLYDNFSRYGAVVSLRLIADDATGQGMATGFVNYADAAGAERARQALNGMRAGDRIMQVLVQGCRPGDGSRTHSNGSDDSVSMAAAAAIIAAAAGQQAHGDWSMLPPPTAAMMW